MANEKTTTEIYDLNPPGALAALGRSPARCRRRRRRRRRSTRPTTRPIRGEVGEGALGHVLEQPRPGEGLEPRLPCAPEAGDGRLEVPALGLLAKEEGEDTMVLKNKKGGRGSMG